MSIIQKIKEWRNLRKEVDRQKEEIEACKNRLNICHVKQDFPVGRELILTAKVVRLYNDGAVALHVFPPASKSVHSVVVFSHYHMINTED